MTERNDERVDILENRIRKLSEELLSVLLKDRSTGKNILWATDNYARHGERYKSDCQIEAELITSYKGEVIKPRTKKGQKEQKMRVREKAEVFTPSWVCNAQNNLIDEVWFEYHNPFNSEKGQTWVTTQEPIRFWNKCKGWKEYVLDKRLEISCGEAPYLVSRYDTVTGEIIETKNRIGMLDRKIRVINEYASTDEWFEWVQKAYQSIYGYEWQGDSLLIARENLLYSFSDYYFEKFKAEPSIEQKIIIAKIISWNIWQMDGLKGTVPNSCKDKKVIEHTLLGDTEINVPCEGCKKGNYFKHNGVYCKIKDWEAAARHKKCVIRFVDLFKQGGGK